MICPPPLNYTAMTRCAIFRSSARREVGQGTESLSLSGSMENGQATALAEAWMARRHAERRTASFSLPWSNAALHVGDRVRLGVLDGQRDYVVTALEDGAMRTVTAAALAPNLVFADKGKHRHARRAARHWI